MDLDQFPKDFNPFMDPSGDVYIQVPVEGETEDHQLHVDSAMARSLIRSRLARILKNGIPTDQQTRAAIDIIKGEAYGKARAVATLSVDYQISRKPLA